MAFVNERNKEIYRLRIEDGLTYAEIGRCYSISAGRVNYIVKTLTNYYEKERRPKKVLEVFFGRNTRIMNCLQQEEVDSIPKLRDLVRRINEGYGVPNIGERSIKLMEATLKWIDEIYGEP